MNVLEMWLHFSSSPRWTTQLGPMLSRQLETPTLPNRWLGSDRVGDPPAARKAARGDAAKAEQMQMAAMRQTRRNQKDSLVGDALKNGAAASGGPPADSL
jgi:hypothetical protein